MPGADEANADLVDQLIAQGALRAAALIAAFRATPRHRFVDRIWLHRDGLWRDLDALAPSEDDLRLVYQDRALTTRLLPGEPGQPAPAISSSSQPSLMAEMLEDLRLAPGQRVLEVGAGTGYNAALLAFVTGDVVSIDIDREVLAEARRHLAAFPDRRVELHHADGRLGLAARGPYDRIQVTAATDELAPAWLAQLVTAGIVQAPLDLAPGLAWLVQGEVTDGVFTGGLTRPAYFMPLRDEGAGGRDRNEPDGPLPGPERLAETRAAWAAWQERRGGPDAADFLPHLALLGWLEGLTLGHATCPDGRAAHGVADLVRGEACWLGPSHWYVTGPGGKELGRRLWRRWLELGGPRAKDWRLRAGGHVAEAAGARASYRRGGQVWELMR